MMRKRVGAKLETITVQGFRCKRCTHVWVPRRGGQAPKVCPKCKSPYWDRDKVMDSGPRRKVRAT